MQRGPVPEGRSKSLSIPEIFVVETELMPFQNPGNANLMRGASIGARSSSRRDSTIVARHEVPGLAMQRGPVPEGRSKSLAVPEIFVVETELVPLQNPGNVNARRFDRRMVFVPEGQHDSSQARSAWVAMQRPRPGGTVEVVVNPVVSPRDILSSKLSSCRFRTLGTLT
jgi:hypothetical protein